MNCKFEKCPDLNEVSVGHKKAEIEWIPVAERCPTEDGRYLTCEKGWVSIDLFYKDGTRDYPGHKNLFVTPDGGDGEWACSPEYWAELPGAPGNES